LKKLMGRLLLAIAVLGVVGLVALKVLLPVDRLVSIAAQTLRERTGAEILHGDVSLDFWPRVTLAVSDVVVRGPVQDPGPRGGLESWSLSANRISGGLALGPLLSRRAELDRLKLEAPVITIVSKPAAGDGAADGKPRSGQIAPDMPVALIAAGAEIHDGSLTWSESGGRQLTIREWRQDVSASELGRLTALLTAWAAASPTVQDGADGSLELAGVVGVIELTNWRPGSPLMFENVALKGRLDVPRDASILGLNDLVLEWEGCRVEGSGQLTSPMSTGRLTLDWKLERYDLERLRPVLAMVLPDTLIEIRTWLKDTSLAVEKLDAAGRVDLPVPTPPTATSADLVQGLVLDLSVEGLRITPPRLRNPWIVDGRLALTDANLRADGVVIRIAEGQLRGSATVGHVGHPDPHCSLTAELEDAPLTTLLEVLMPSAVPYLVGGADGAVTGRFRLGEPDVVRGSLALAGELVLRDGVIHAQDWLHGITPYLKGRQDLQDIRYRTLRHAFEVVDGRYVIQGLDLHGPDTDWRGDGWVGLDGTIDLDLNVKLPTGFTPDLGSMTMLAESLRGEDGRLSLDLNLTGRAARPTVGLDLSQPQGNLQDAVQQGVQGLLDKFRNKR